MEDRIIDGAPQLIPWKMSDEEIEKIGGPLAEELKKAKQRFLANQPEQTESEEQETIDDYIVQLKKAGFETDSILSLEDAFNFTLNQIGELNNIVDSLRALADEKEKAEQERQKIEQQYMTRLEGEVKSHFRILLQTQDEKEKKNTLQTVRDLVLGPLEAKFLGEGYAVTENKNGSFDISFENIEAAQWFNWKFHDVRGLLYNDILVRYQELQIERQALRDKLRDKGLESSSFEADFQNKAKKELLEKVSKIDELARMPQEKLVKEYMELIDQLMLVESQVSVFEDLWPEIKDKSGSEKWIYVADRVQELQGAEKESKRLLERQQDRYRILEKGLNNYIQKNKDLDAAIEFINQKIAAHSKKALGALSGIAEYLRKNNIVCDFGYAEPEERKPLGYLSAVSSGVCKLEEAVKRVVQERNFLRKASLDLEAENKALQEFAKTAVDGAKELSKKLDEFKYTPEETEQRNALLKRVHIIQHFFIRYTEAAGISEAYPDFRKEILNVSFENMISDYYLKMLDEAIALVKDGFSGLEALMSVQKEKKELASQYGCGSFDELKSRVMELNERVSALQEKEEAFASDFEAYRNERAIKPKTIATVHAHWTDYLRADHLGDDEEKKKILGKLYLDEDPEDPEAERNKVMELFGKYEDILSEKLSLVEDLETLEPEFDPNFNKKKEKIQEKYSGLRQEDELREYLGRSKTVEKATELVNKMYKQVVEGVYRTIKSKPQQKLAENFTLLSDLGNVFGKEIETPGDLLDILKEEKEIFSGYIETYRREKDKILVRLNQ